MLHDGFKFYHRYNNVRVVYKDGVNYMTNKSTLDKVMSACKNKYPNSMVWYEVISVKPSEYGWGISYADIKVIYKEERSIIEHEFNAHDENIYECDEETLWTCPVITNVSTHKVVTRPKVSTGIYFNGTDHSVKNHLFHGTKDECEKYLKYYRNAAECYKARAKKCKTWTDLVIMTDITGNCITVKHTAQRKHNSESFRSRMNSGNRYQY